MESGIQVKPQYFYLYQNPMSFFQPSGLQCFFHGGIQPGLEQKGDEIDCLGDSWFFFVWTSDSSPHSTHSAKSRWPICILPASLYAYANDVNISLEAVTLAITNSFNRLSTEGVKIRNLPSLGGNAVPLFEIISSDVHGLVFIFFEVCTDVYLVSLKSPCLWFLVDVWPCQPVLFTAQVCKLRMFVMGFRGDWKALVQLFNLTRTYNTNQVRARLDL